MLYNKKDTGIVDANLDYGWVTFEFTLGLMIASFRGFPLYLENQRNKIWEHSQQKTLNGKKIAIIGNGRIGRKFRHIQTIFPTTTIHRFSRNGGDDSHPISNFFRDVESYDVIVVLIPINEDSINMFDKKIFSRIKDGALFINMSYGPVVNTDDLVEELNKNRFFAAIDQVNPNPLPADHPLWDCPNVIITPHVASNAR